jgi:hypothetical protein
MKKKQKIFFYHNNVKVEVKPKLLETTYRFKLNDREIFQIIVPVNDSEIARKTVCKEIDKLGLN